MYRTTAHIPWHSDTLPVNPHENHTLHVLQVYSTKEIINKIIKMQWNESLDTPQFGGNITTAGFIQAFILIWIFFFIVKVFRIAIISTYNFSVSSSSHNSDTNFTRSSFAVSFFSFSSRLSSLKEGNKK